MQLIKQRVEQATGTLRRPSEILRGPLRGCADSIVLQKLNDLSTSSWLRLFTVLLIPINSNESKETIIPLVILSLVCTHGKEITD